MEMCGVAEYILWVWITVLAVCCVRVLIHMLSLSFSLSFSLSLSICVCVCLENIPWHQSASRGARYRHRRQPGGGRQEWVLGPLRDGVQPCHGNCHLHEECIYALASCFTYLIYGHDS